MGAVPVPRRERKGLCAWVGLEASCRRGPGLVGMKGRGLMGGRDGAASGAFRGWALPAEAGWLQGGPLPWTRWPTHSREACIRGRAGGPLTPRVWASQPHPQLQQRLESSRERWAPPRGAHLLPREVLTPQGAWAFGARKGLSRHLVQSLGCIDGTMRAQEGEEPHGQSGARIGAPTPHIHCHTTLPQLPAGGARRSWRTSPLEERKDETRKDSFCPGPLTVHTRAPPCGLWRPCSLHLAQTYLPSRGAPRCRNNCPGATFVCRSAGAPSRQCQATLTHPWGAD